MVLRVHAPGQGFLVHLGQEHVARGGKVEPFLAEEAQPVLDVAAKGALPDIEVQRPHAMPHPRQRRGDVHGDGALARAALFVAHDDDMRHSVAFAAPWAV